MRLFALAAMASLLITTPGHAQFVLYDNFASGVIDPEKWYGSSIDGNADGPSAEILRRIENGQLRLSVTSYGNNHSDSGTINNRVDLRPKELGIPGGTGFITAIKANITVLAAKIQGCESNAGSGNVRAQVQGYFFNDGTSTSADDRTGNIGGFFQMQKQVDGSQPFLAGIFRCSDSGCNTTTTAAQAIFSSTWSLNEAVNMKLAWDKGTGKFSFSAKGEVHDVFYPMGLVDNGPPKGDHKALRVSNFIENCNGAYKRGRMDALFDDVQVKRQP